MVRFETLTASPRTGSMTDADLLHEIATQRSQPAFTELYQRYETAAYNLAYSLTHNRAVSEEAVQNALLRIWQSASTFQPGNARGWILRIVAREGLKLIKGQRLEQKRKMESETLTDRVKPSAPAEGMEQSEVLAALQDALHRLPELERQYVTLHFVGGLSHDEIAQELSTPRQTVSRHIQNTLRSLRGDLTTAGFAAALPIIGAETLSQICCSGQAAPPGLREKVLSGMARPSLKSQRVSRGVKAAGPKSAALLVVGVTVAAAAGAALWMVSSAPKAPQPSPPLTTLQAVAPVRETTPQWEPVTDDFHTVAGQAAGVWKAVKAPNGLTLQFTPAAGDGQKRSWCYVGHNISASQELRGTLEYLGSEETGYVELGLCMPNRFNCTTEAVPFQKSLGPLKIRIQIRVESRGCRLAISVQDAAGREHAVVSQVPDWTPPPWTHSQSAQKSTSTPMTADNVILYDQCAFEQMKECGFGFATRDAIRISELQVRPLVDREWVPDRTVGNSGQSEK